MELVGRVDPELGTALGEVLGVADVLVDFTTPETATANAREALAAGVHCVVGTTGFDSDELRAAAEAAADGARCFAAPNFAIGAVLLMQFARQAAAQMPDCVFLEVEH